MNLENNFYVVGVLVDFIIEEWAPNKFNRKLVINQPYRDKHGNDNANYTNVNIHSDDMPAIQAFNRDHKGLRVSLPFRINLRSGTSQKGPYAFNDFYMPKGLKPQVLSASGSEATKPKTNPLA